MATWNSGKGFFNLSANNTSLVAWHFEDFVEYDDPVNKGLAEFMMIAGSTQEVGTPEFFCFAGELNPRTGTLNETGTVATNGVLAIVTSTDGVRVDDVLHFPSAGAVGEHVRVTAIGTNSFTFARMNTTPATLATNATYVMLGSASSTIATAGIGGSFMEPAKVTNRTQLLRRGFQISETEDMTDLRVQTRFKMKSDQARWDFRLDLAHTFWFGISTSDSTNTYMTTKGINEQLVSNGSSLKINVNGALAMSNLSAGMEAVAPYAQSYDYAVFVGGTALGGIADLATLAGVGAQDVMSKVYGSAAQTVVVGNFRFTFKYERLFDVIGTPYSGYAYGLDMKSIILYHMKGAKFQFQPNTKSDPLSEVMTSQFKANVGLGVTWPKRHLFWRGIT